jgi:hypothetical protein
LLIVLSSPYVRPVEAADAYDDHGLPILLVDGVDPQRTRTSALR